MTGLVNQHRAAIHMHCRISGGTHVHVVRRLPTRCYLARSGVPCSPFAFLLWQTLPDCKCAMSCGNVREGGALYIWCDSAGCLTGLPPLVGRGETHNVGGLVLSALSTTAWSWQTVRAPLAVRLSTESSRAEPKHSGTQYERLVKPCLPAHPTQSKS
jgi:hypothetical protein